MKINDVIKNILAKYLINAFIQSLKIEKRIEYKNQGISMGHTQPHTNASKKQSLAAINYELNKTPEQIREIDYKKSQNDINYFIEELKNVGGSKKDIYLCKMLARLIFSLEQNKINNKYIRRIKLSDINKYMKGYILSFSIDNKNIYYNICSQKFKSLFIEGDLIFRSPIKYPLFGKNYLKSLLKRFDKSIEKIKLLK